MISASILFPDLLAGVTSDSEINLESPAFNVLSAKQCGACRAGHLFVEVSLRAGADSADIRCLEIRTSVSENQDGEFEWSIADLYVSDSTIHVVVENECAGKDSSVRWFLNTFSLAGNPISTREILRSSVDYVDAVKLTREPDGRALVKWHDARWKVHPVE